MTPTRRALLLLAVGLAIAILPAAGLRRAWPATALFWAGAALLLGADALRCPRRGDVTFSIDAPRALHAGGREPLGLRVSIATPRPLPLEAAIGLSDDLAAQPALRGAAGREPAALAWELVPSRRGLARLETLWLRWESPLGFWTRRIVSPLDRELPVLPDLPRVRAAAIRFFADRDFRAGLRIERYRG
ncbi:MAG TPA: hypothetical protein VMS88_07245, partial [Terriglobales bacterium]|nr:hypothetical protein [Terriglobales bacterium]